MTDVKSDFIEGPLSSEELGVHYTDALNALTARRAFLKSDCAVLIAEKAKEAADAIERSRKWKKEVKELLAEAEITYQEGNPEEWLATIWATLEEARETISVNTGLPVIPYEQWDDICEAMAKIRSHLGLPDEVTLG